MTLTATTWTTRLRTAIVAAALLLPAAVPSAALFMPSAAWAEPQNMTVLLSGAHEVPPVETPGKGTAILIFDPATSKLSWTVEYFDLTGPATMAHFHGPAKPGANAPALIWLANKGDAFTSPITGEAVLTPEQAKDFAAGLWYVNVHTPANPAGEIRGLIPAAK